MRPRSAGKPAIAAGEGWPSAEACGRGGGAKMPFGISIRSNGQRKMRRVLALGCVLSDSRIVVRNNIERVAINHFGAATVTCCPVSVGLPYGCASAQPQWRDSSVLAQNIFHRDIVTDDLASRRNGGLSLVHNSRYFRSQCMTSTPEMSPWGKRGRFVTLKMSCSRRVGGEGYGWTRWKTCFKMPIVILVRL